MGRWRLAGQKRWREPGARVYCGEADNITVRIARRPRQCVQGCPIGKGQPYVDYWLIGDPHTTYCVAHAPLRVVINSGGDT